MPAKDNQCFTNAESRERTFLTPVSDPLEGRGLSGVKGVTFQVLAVQILVSGNLPKVSWSITVLVPRG